MSLQDDVFFFSLFAIFVRRHKQIAIVRHQSNTYTTDRTAAATIRTEIGVAVIRPNVRVRIDAQCAGILCRVVFVRFKNAILIIDYYQAQIPASTVRSL